MTQVEVLETSVAFPLNLNSTAGRDEGVPAEILSQCGPIKPWFLVAWNDDVSGTIGLLHKKHALVLQRNNVVGLALNFMRPAKGQGLVALDVDLQDQKKWLNLLYSPFFRRDAVDWVVKKKTQIEAVFSVPIAIFDRGSDY